MKFPNDDFSESEKEILKSHYTVMESWYSKLVGAKIVGVSFNVAEELDQIPFPVLHLSMPDGAILEMELVSSEDMNVPGWMLGISSIAEFQAQ